MLISSREYFGHSQNYLVIIHCYYWKAKKLTDHLTNYDFYSVLWCFHEDEFELGINSGINADLRDQFSRCWNYHQLCLDLFKIYLNMFKLWFMFCLSIFAYWWIFNNVEDFSHNFGYSIKYNCIRIKKLSHKFEAITLLIR